MTELLIGCGSRRLNITGRKWSCLITLDINRDHKPDVVCDLTKLPLPFADNKFDEIHAYEVLEHIGGQGDYRIFFAQFSDFWRILKPNGTLYATVPSPQSQWVWADPSHSRAILPDTLIFLDQDQYKRQVGKTAMTDFRYLYRADFTTIYSEDTGENFVFAIKAIKPSRIDEPECSNLEQFFEFLIGYDQPPTTELTMPAASSAG